MKISKKSLKRQLAAARSSGYNKGEHFGRLIESNNAKAILQKEDRELRLRELAVYEKIAVASASVTENLARLIMYGTNQRFGGGPR